jgi:hypothetical protein
MSDYGLFRRNAKSSHNSALQYHVCCDHKRNVSQNRSVFGISVIASGRLPTDGRRRDRLNAPGFVEIGSHTTEISLKCRHHPVQLVELDRKLQCALEPKHEWLSYEFSKKFGFSNILWIMPQWALMETHQLPLKSVHKWPELRIFQEIRIFDHIK